MSNLEGTLSPKTISKILQVLISKNPAATWLISDGENEKVVYFSTGGIRLYASPERSVAPLEDYLVRSKAISSEQLGLARNEMEKDRRQDLAEVLEVMGWLPRERLHGATAELIFCELCDLITWENAIFEFYNGNPPPEIFDQEHPALFAGLDVTEFADKVRGWCQEWGQLKSKLYSERLCPKMLVDTATVAETGGLGAEARHIYRLIDGQRSLRELSRVSGYDFPTVARVIKLGMEAGHLSGSLIPQKVATTAEEIVTEVEKLEDALDRAINTILVHKRIATNYEKIDQKERASEHYESIGQIHTDNGQLENAVESYRRAVDLSPENINAHESLIRRLQDAGQDDGALDEIVNLAKKFVNFGFLKRACESLRSVATKVPERYDVRILFADVLAKLGRVQEAVAQYLGVAQDRARLGDLDGIEELYMKVLTLDPVNREARAGVAGERKRQAGKSAVWIHRLSTAAAVLLLAAWGSMEVTSRTAWARTKADIDRSVASGEVTAGLAQLRTYREKYPGSLFVPTLLSLEEELFRSGHRLVEKDLEDARRLEDEGWLTQAGELYDRVLENATVPSQIRRARERIGIVDELHRKWKEVRRRAVEFVDKRHFEKGFQLCREIIENFPEGAEGLRVPYYIRTSPPAATIKVNNAPRATSPAWITVRWGRGQTVQVERYGYGKKDIDDLEERTSPIIRVELE